MDKELQALKLEIEQSRKETQRMSRESEALRIKSEQAIARLQAQVDKFIQSHKALRESFTNLRLRLSESRAKRISSERHECLHSDGRVAFELEELKSLKFCRAWAGSSEAQGYDRGTIKRLSHFL